MTLTDEGFFYDGSYYRQGVNDGISFYEKKKEVFNEGEYTKISRDDFLEAMANYYTIFARMERERERQAQKEKDLPFLLLDELQKISAQLKELNNEVSTIRAYGVPLCR